MEPFEERLIVEQKELKERLAKLTDFINSEKFYALSPNKRLVLKNQKIAMELYLNVLNMRVFEDVDKIVVPDYGFLQMMGNVFAGSGPFAFKPNSETHLEGKVGEGKEVVYVPSSAKKEDINNV